MRRALVVLLVAVSVNLAPVGVVQATAASGVALPSAPVSLNASRPGSGSNGVTLTWAPPTSTGGSPIEGYWVDLSTDGGTTWTNNWDRYGAAATSATGVYCPEATPCKYRLHAYTANGEGPATSVATLRDPLPTAPSSFRASRPGSGSNGVTLTWAPPTSTGGSPIEGYWVDLSTDGGTTWTNNWDRYGAAATSATGVYCPEATPCKYRLHAYTANGEGPASTVAAVS